MSLDDFWAQPAASVDEYAPNPNTPPTLRTFEAKWRGVPVAGALATNDKHPDQVHIWWKDEDGKDINEAVERDSLTELKFQDD